MSDDEEFDINDFLNDYLDKHKIPDTEWPELGFSESPKQNNVADSPKHIVDFLTSDVQRTNIKNTDASNTDVQKAVVQRTDAPSFENVVESTDADIASLSDDVESIASTLSKSTIKSAVSSASFMTSASKKSNIDYTLINIYNIQILSLKNKLAKTDSSDDMHKILEQILDIERKLYDIKHNNIEQQIAKKKEIAKKKASDAKKSLKKAEEEIHSLDKSMSQSKQLADERIKKAVAILIKK